MDANWSDLDQGRQSSDLERCDERLKKRNKYPWDESTVPAPSQLFRLAALRWGETRRFQARAPPFAPAIDPHGQIYRVPCPASVQNCSLQPFGVPRVRFVPVQNQGREEQPSTSPRWPSGRVRILRRNAPIPRLQHDVLHWKSSSYQPALHQKMAKRLHQPHMHPITDRTHTRTAGG